MSDRDRVHRQYVTEDNLETRMSVWHPTEEGREPACEALASLTQSSPAEVLEVGCGTGAFASRIAAALPKARLVAVDQSERFVELTSRRGLDGRHADVQDLPFDDNSFDAVVAMWMLYHVTDHASAVAYLRSSQEDVDWQLPAFDGAREYAGHVTVFVAEGVAS